MHDHLFLRCTQNATCAVFDATAFPVVYEDAMHHVAPQWVELISRRAREPERIDGFIDGFAILTVDQLQSVHLHPISPRRAVGILGNELLPERDRVGLVEFDPRNRDKSRTFPR